MGFEKNAKNWKRRADNSFNNSKKLEEEDRHNEAAACLFESFIYYWITFNALYAHDIQSEHEKDQIADFLSKLDITHFEVILKSKPSKYFKDNIVTSCLPKLDEKGKPYKYKSTESQTHILDSEYCNDTEKLIALMLSVYQVRCNLFHGQKSPGIYNDYEKVKNGVFVLKDLLDVIFNKTLTAVTKKDNNTEVDGEEL